jgi:NAD(P)-dependent dehydrogenase (short-subunit alcohol dehydrogenase family)
MDLGLQGRVALVSGGSRGIGRACCEQFAQEGCAVAVVGRTESSVEATVSAIREAGGKAIGAIGDMTIESDVQKVVALTKDKLGAPDIVITNVHGGTPGDVLSESVEEFRNSFEQLVMSVVYLARATLPDMKVRSWGRLLTLGTAAAKEPAPGMKLMAANTARAAVVTLNKQLADEFASDGITVNTIATGWVGTGHMQDQVHQMAAARGKDGAEFLQRIAKGVPVGRIAEPSEIASLAVYLCSDRAGYLTGSLIPADGGAHRSAW